MCLIDTRRFRFTFKRIPIYKVVEIQPDGSYISPFQRTPVTKKCKFKAGEPIKSVSYNFKDLKTETIFSFGRGFYHAYTDLNKASLLKNTLEINDYFSCININPNYKIITGYIPPFTRYAIEKYGDICARRMILNI